MLIGNLNIDCHRELLSKLTRKRLTTVKEYFETYPPYVLRNYFVYNNVCSIQKFNRLTALTSTSTILKAPMSRIPHKFHFTGV